MKRILAAALAATALMTAGECAMAEDIAMTIGKSVYTVTLLQNDAAKDFASKLPMTLAFEDYASIERIAYPKEKLSLGSAPREATPVRGDFAYYAPWGNLCAFVRPFRASSGLVPLGHMDEAAIAALQASGNTPVTFSRKR